MLLPSWLNIASIVSIFSVPQKKGDTKVVEMQNDVFCVKQGASHSFKWHNNSTADKVTTRPKIKSLKVENVSSQSFNMMRPSLLRLLALLCDTDRTSKCVFLVWPSVSAAVSSRPLMEKDKPVKPVKPVALMSEEQRFPSS